MTRSLQLLLGIALLATSAAGLANAPADDAAAPRALIEQGNALYADGRYAEALEIYDQAAESAGGGDLADLLHNRAAAHFKLGQIDEARELWARAKSLGDAGFEARARYNLGNCDYAAALAATQQQSMPMTKAQQQPDPKKIIELLGQAADQYRAALSLDPTFDDARANLELAHLLRRQIEEQMQNQPQSQPSSDQSQKDDQSEQDGQKDQGQQQSSSQPSSQPESQPGDQQQQDEQSQSDQDNSQQQSGDEEQQKEEQEENQASDAENDQDQQDQQEEQASAAESQPSEADQQEEQQAVTMTREQAERLLQKVRDAEKARREALARRRAQRQKPVERDW